jgi:hypothetical protein
MTPVRRPGTAGTAPRTPEEAWRGLAYVVARYVHRPRCTTSSVGRRRLRRSLDGSWL